METLLEEENSTNILPHQAPNKIKKVVKSMLQGYASPCFSCGSCLNQQGATSGGRAMQLCFVNKLLSEIFTMVNFKAEGGVPIQIDLRYAASQQRVVMEEVSTIKIQICVLDGEFGNNGNEDWTAEEFNAQTVKPRKGKGPLLKGETVIKLENGAACINKVVFTDNSCAARNKKFRLGAKIVQPNSVGADIREGRSEAFKVKDNRGESYKKHYPLSLNDEVWRLKIIEKGGSWKMTRLGDLKLITIKDVLHLFPDETSTKPTTSDCHKLPKVFNTSRPKGTQLPTIQQIFSRRAASSVYNDDKVTSLLQGKSTLNKYGGPLGPDKRKKTVQSVSSFVTATIVFLWIIFDICINSPITQQQALHKQHAPVFIWSSLLEMFGFMVFVWAIAAMIVVGAPFSSMQCAMFMFWAILMLVGSAKSITEVYLPILGVLFAGWYMLVENQATHEG